MGEIIVRSGWGLCWVAAAIALSFTTHLAAQDLEKSPEEERLAAIEDVESAYAIFAQHHPGMYDPYNPGFPALLSRARDAALVVARDAQDHTDHALALTAFSQVLADGHAWAFVGYSGQGTLWPGFATEWRGQALMVTDAGNAGPPRGAALISCDGQNADSLIREQVFSITGRPEEAGHWWIYADWLFSRPQMMRTDPPQSCTFRHPDSTVVTHALAWSAEPESRFWAAIEKGKRPPVGLTYPRPGISLIALPTFSPGPEEQDQYEMLYEALDKMAHAGARAIVIDLRRNGGGSSSWSYNVAKRLWGGPAVDWAMADYFRETEIWYLADEANLSHFQDIETRYRERGLDEIADFAAEMVTQLTSAREMNATFFKEAYGKDLLAEASPAKPKETPPVYVITDGGCASACLDAVDIFTRFPGVKLVGAPTSADSEYLEVRRQKLASGRGIAILPTKIWIKRPRASGEVYQPDILVTDLDWTTNAILDHVERDITSSINNPG